MIVSKQKSAVCLFIVVLVCVRCSLGDATDLYVSTTGNDNNPGTRNQPFASLAKAQTAARKIKGSVTILLREGVYYLPAPIIFTPEDARSVHNKVVYKSFAEEKVRISGATSLSLNWIHYEAGIMKAKVPPGLIFDQLFIDGIQMSMARYPNYDSAAKYYNGFAADALSRERINRWANPAGGYIHSLHRHEWGGFHSVIKGKDKEGNLETEGGWQNNRQMGMHTTIRFVENIREELDTPGEWYYDRQEHMLYVFPLPQQILQSALVEVPQLKSLFEFRGTEKQPVTHIRIEGFELSQTLRTFMDTREPLLRSDWAIYRGGTIIMEGAEDCIIKRCHFNTVGGNAVFFSNYNRRNEVASCHINAAGGSGIAFVGNPTAVRSPSFEYNEYIDYEKLDPAPGPQNNDYPKDCKAYDNLIHDIGRIEKQAAGVQISMAMNITVAHNSIYDVPRAGINIGDGCWGGHVLEFNDVFNTVLETGDHGAFNSWGRDRFWHPNYEEMQKISLQNPALILADVIHPITIRNNRFRCDHGWDIDLDDGSSNYRIYNNVCLNGGIKLREGFKRVVENNVLVNNTLHPHLWFLKSKDVFRHNIVLDNYKPIQVKEWGEQVDYNFFPDTISLAMARKNNTDQHSKSGDPLFINPFTGDYRVKESSGALAIGFKNFPMNQFGVQSPSLKRISQQPQFPQQLYSTMIHSDLTVTDWLGASIKKLTGLGERSATGLSEEKGVYVQGVKPGSVAEKMGLKKNDVILKVDGKNVATNKDVISLYQDAIWKGKLPFQLFRNQQEITLDILTKH